MQNLVVGGGSDLQQMVGGGVRFAINLQNMLGWGLDLQFILLKNIWNWSAQILRIFGDLTFRIFAD